MNTNDSNAKNSKTADCFTKIILPVIGIITISFYFVRLGSNGLSGDGAEWGAFGSYIGGILSPLIAGAALIWLIKSVTIQKTELKETRLILQKQSDQIDIQSFENLFFSLLQEKSNIEKSFISGSRATLENLVAKTDFSTSKINDITNVRGRELIKDSVILFKNNSKYDWEKFYEDSFLDIFGIYFRLNYQIVKLIDNNITIKDIEYIEFKKYSKKQKQYFDIFRATFTAYEYELLFFNCLSKYGNKNFKPLLEKYGMFEPMFSDINRSNEKTHSLTKYAYKYNRSIFKNNESWEKYFKKIDLIRSIKSESIISNLELLLEKSIIQERQMNNYERIIIHPAANTLKEHLQNVLSTPLDKDLQSKIQKLIKNNSIMSSLDFIIKARIPLKNIENIYNVKS